MDRTDFASRYKAARRAAIELDFKRLNETQLEAVMTTRGPLLLLAGAGSGKTTVLMNRIANLLKYGCGSDSEYVPESATEDDLIFLETYASNDLYPEHAARIRELCTVDPVEPWRVIAITFTNKAAGEMKERLARIIGPASEDVWASTFHSACVRILRRDIDKLGYDKSFTIYDTADCASLMKRILKESDIDEKNFPHKTILTYISRAKDEMIAAGDFFDSAQATGDIRRKIIGRAYIEYEKRMRSSNSLDFDDLILFTVRLFQECPDVLEHYQRRFKYVLVDEYQDTNYLQYLFASALAGGNALTGGRGSAGGYGNICVVGDDDQSIYKFRGATIENILNFEKHFKDARVIRLEQNYRSTGLILDAANDVIRNNTSRKGKKLWTDSSPGEAPAMHVLSDERAEAQFVADKIVTGASGGMNWREHAVLYRMNAQSYQFETAFKRAGIPYRIFGGTGFYERAEIKDMLAYLCIIYNPHDDVRLLRVINNPPRGIGATTVGRLSGLAAESDRPVFEIIRESQNHSSLKASSGRLHQFADMIDQLRVLSATAPLDELYDALVDRTGYIRMLEGKGTDENYARIENVRELKTNIISFMNESGGSLFDFLSETALFTDMDRDDNSLDRVMMMTMHSAKGLEFDTVFVVGAEEGIFPGLRSIGELSEIEEERRLCYVAMTRAMRKLFFTATQRRMLFGKTSASTPSRFVLEISGENIEMHEPQSRFGSFDFDYDDGYEGYGGYGGYASYGGGYGGIKKADRRRSTAGRPYGDSQAEADSSRPAAGRPYGGNSQAEAGPSRPPTAGPPSPDAPHFAEGDSVMHKAFGRGVIKGLSPAGGDALLEIAFDESGVKRLMLKSAARYMTKVERIDK